MLAQTKTAIAALLAADGSIPKETQTRALALLGGAEVPRPLGRVIRYAEAARLLGVTRKTLREWAKAGALEGVYRAGSNVRAGFTEASVRALVEGRGNRAEA
ncbi:MAG: helix-turn-helix domain-containing protein [Kiritimatiellae bacterium]|nr:helix-turn-helix domain-containing protein [Kiritimatiellia bacterium]